MSGLDSLEFNPSFPKTQEKISSLREEKKELCQLLSKAKELEKRVQETKDFAKELERYSLHVSSLLAEIKRLAGEKDFPEALAAVSKLKDGMPSGAEQLSREVDLIASWSEARLFSLWGENNIASGNLPLSREKAEEHYRRCLALPENLESEAAKDSLLDEARGFLYLIIALQVPREEHDLQQFEKDLPYWKMALENESSCSSITRSRAMLLRESLLQEFNQLSHRYFGQEKNVEKALSLFRLRDAFPRELLEVLPYRYDYDENEFRISFLENEALASEGDEYRKTVTRLSKECDSPDSLSFKALTRLLTLPGLEESKFRETVRAFSRLSLPLKVHMTAGAVALGILPKHLEALLKALASSHKKKGDLEEMAKDLLFIEEHLNEPLKRIYDPLLRGLLRSPKAHLVVSKSNSTALHVLAGQSDGVPYRPLGKKLENKNVRAWSPFRLVLFWVLGVFLPIAFCVFAGLFLYYYEDLDANRCSFALLGPGLLSLVWVLAVLTRWLGKDEKGSSVARTVLLADALWKEWLSFVYFYMPRNLILLGRVRYAMLILSVIEAFAAFFHFRPTKKSGPWDYSLFAAGFVGTLLALIYMILDMIQYTV